MNDTTEHSGAVTDAESALSAEASPTEELAADGGTDTADAPATAAPVTSLSALLGGSFEGGTACAADGTCD